MRLSGSDRPGDLSPNVAADLLGVIIADPGLESGLQTVALCRVLGKGLKTLALLEEVRALLVDDALRGGGAWPRYWLDQSTKGQEKDHTLHCRDTRRTVH